jgi:hypothetical protein
MEKQHLTEKTSLTRRHFLKTIALGGVSLMGGLALVSRSNETSADRERAAAPAHSRAFSARASIDIETGKMPARRPAFATVSENRQTTGRQRG